MSLTITMIGIAGRRQSEWRRWLTQSFAKTMDAIQPLISAIAVVISP